MPPGKETEHSEEMATIRRLMLASKRNEDSDTLDVAVVRAFRLQQLLGDEFDISNPVTAQILGLVHED